MIKLIGARFTKISAVRKNITQGNISISNHVKVLSIEKMKEVKDSLEVKYLFEVDYSEMGKVEIEGNIFIKCDGKELKELLKSWENKKFDSQENVVLTNIIIQKASIKAITLEDELGLPTHIKLPSLQLKK